MDCDQLDSILNLLGGMKVTALPPASPQNIKKQIFLNVDCVPGVGDTVLGKTGVPPLIELVTLSSFIHSVNEEIIEQLISTQQEELSNYQSCSKGA